MAPIKNNTEPFFLRVKGRFRKILWETQVHVSYSGYKKKRIWDLYCMCTSMPYLTHMIYIIRTIRPELCVSDKRDIQNKNGYD